MSIKRKYYNKFLRSGNKGMLEYFSSLNLEDWIDFFDDYCTHETTSLSSILRSPKGEDIYSYGLSWLDDVDAVTKALISKANDYLLATYLANGQYRLLDDLLFSISYLELTVNSASLLEIIKNHDLSKELRENAGLTLSITFENSLIPFWDCLDLKTESFLVPAYISFFEKINPLKGLSILQIIQDQPQSLSEFVSPILYSLKQISISPSELEKYAILKKSLPQWSLSLIDDIIKEYNDLKDFNNKLNRIGDGINKPPTKMQKVRLGLSVLPDFMVPLLFNDMGLFGDYGIELEIVFKPWNLLYELLIKDVVDVIIGNEKVMNYLNKEQTPPIFKQWMTLDEFNGWTIFSRYKIKTYEEFKKENKSTALKNTLGQMKNKSVFAPKNTDYYFTFLELIEKNGFKHNDFQFMKSIDPHLGFLNFLNGKGDFFIGGALHAKKAITDNYYQVISEETENFGAKQRNVFVTQVQKKKNAIYIEGVMTKFVFIFNRGLDILEEDRKSYNSQLFNLFKYNLNKHYIENYNQLMITEEDFNSIITSVIEYKQARIVDFKVKELNVEEAKNDSKIVRMN